MKTILIVLVMSGAVLAADKPNVPTRVQALEEEVNSLKQQIAQLRKEISELKEQIESLRPPSSHEVDDAIKAGDFAIGEREDQAKKTVNDGQWAFRETPTDTEQILGGQRLRDSKWDVIRNGQFRVLHFHNRVLIEIKRGEDATAR